MIYIFKKCLTNIIKYDKIMFCSKVMSMKDDREYHKEFEESPGSIGQDAG